jgi:NAD(P)H-dependent FMN reductase
MDDKRVLVVYYSSSGNTRQVAQRIAQALSADVEQIREVNPRHVDIKGRGLANFLNMGRAVLGGMAKRPASIREVRHDPDDYDLTVIGTPVYANSLPAPVRAYLDRTRKRLGEVAFFCTGEDPSNAHIFDLMEAACGRAPKAVCAFHAPVIRAGEFLPQVQAFVSRL